MKLLVRIDREHDFKVFGVDEPLQQPPAILVLRLIQHGSPHVPDVRVNRIAEHQQLDDRNEQREEQRRWVANDVDDFLAGNGSDALHGSGKGHAFSPGCDVRPENSLKGPGLLGQLYGLCPSSSGRLFVLPGIKLLIRALVASCTLTFSLDRIYGAA